MGGLACGARSRSRPFIHVWAVAPAGVGGIARYFVFFPMISVWFTISDIGCDSWNCRTVQLAVVGMYRIV